MPNLEVRSPSNAPQDILKLVESVSVEGGQVVLKMDDNSRFIIYQLLLNMTTSDTWESVKVETLPNEDGYIWKPIFTWQWDGEEDFPQAIVAEDDPLVTYGIRITITKVVESDTFPGIGVDYAPAKLMVTEPPTTDVYTVLEKKFVVKRFTEEIWFPIRYAATKIYDVYFVNAEGFQSLTYKGHRSRYAEDTELQPGEYKYDPVMETVIVRADTFDRTLWRPDPDYEVYLFCDYVYGGGAKALVPIEAVEKGPMYDVDPGTIIRIHPDDYDKLPQEEGEDALEWQVINDNELQGGYQYWNAEYIDLVAYRFDKERTGDGPGFHEGYRGSGIDFQKVGAAPDSFDKDVGDYRQFWIGPDGKFVEGLWQTKVRGYVTFIGPPNKVVPTKIKVFAPKDVRYDNDFGQDDSITGAADALSPRIPNGGINPAPLVVKLNASTANDFPDADHTRRKTAAFKPRLLVYLRERTKYVGSTHWKDVGEGYGVESEQTGVPYWLT